MDLQGFLDPVLAEAGREAVDQADPATEGVVTQGTAPTGIGHSRVVGPDGSVRHCLGARPGILVADVDVDEVAAVREKTSVLANRRLGTHR